MYLVVPLGRLLFISVVLSFCMCLCMYLSRSFVISLVLSLWVSSGFFVYFVMPSFLSFVVVFIYLVR